MKQIIISNPKIIIDKFYQSLKNMKSAYDNSLMNKNIQIFLLEEFGSNLDLFRKYSVNKFVLDNACNVAFM